MFLAYQDIINEYKEQVRTLRAQISELEDACKSKDAALKRSLQNPQTHINR